MAKRIYVAKKILFRAKDVFSWRKVGPILIPNITSNPHPQPIRPAENLQEVPVVDANYCKLVRVTIWKNWVWQVDNGGYPMIPRKKIHGFSSSPASAPRCRDAWRLPRSSSFLQSFVNGLANFQPEKPQVVHFYQHVPIHPILTYNKNIILGPQFTSGSSTGPGVRLGGHFFRGMGLPIIDRGQEQDPNVPRFRNLNKLSISFQWINTNKKWIGCL